MKYVYWLLTICLLLPGRMLAQKMGHGQVPDNVELAALQEIYQDTHGSDWSNNTNWLSGSTMADVATWAGVTVSNGDVTGLELSTNNLNGYLSPAIARLEALQILDLSQNNLSGQLPNELSQLTNLQYLQVSHNQFNKKTPSLSAQVIEVDISYNQLSGPLDLADLTTSRSLTYLDASHNNFSGSLTGIAQHGNLEYLSVANNAFSGTLPAELWQLSDPFYLDISSNQFTGALPYDLNNRGLLNDLYYLDLSGNQLDGPLPASLNSLGNLLCLYLDHNRLNGPLPTLSNLTQLQELNLAANQFAGSLPDFGACTALAYARFDQNQFSGPVPASLFALPNLVYLWLDHNDFTSLPVFAGNSNLLSVHVTSNHLDFAALESYFGGPGNAVYLDFAYTDQSLPADEHVLAVTTGQPWSLPSAIGGSYSHYQWQRAVVGGAWQTLPATTATYQRSAAAATDAGRYRCVVVNDRVTGITLYSPVTTVQVQRTLPPNNPSADLDRNWTVERTYDGNGETANNVISEGKQFVDGLGRATQTQARNAATQQTFAEQTIYNSGGQAVLQTLAAPTNNQGFAYKTDFVTAGASAYGPSNFEGPKASAPDAVDKSTLGTLGYYFSKNNELEPLTPVTSYPYSLKEPYLGPLGGTKRAAAPGDELRMGKGREVKGRDFLVRQEFDNYLALRPQFVPGSTATTLEYQAVKTISVDADGRESFVVTNTDGQAIISGLSSSQYAALPVAGYLTAETPPAADPRAPLYVDVHIPAAGNQEITFTPSGSTAGSIRIVELLTDASYDYPVTTASIVTPPAGSYAYTLSSTDTRVTLPPGFYRIVTLSGTQRYSYAAHYGNLSYTYYDEAGRAVATVAPNGLELAAIPNPGLVGSWPLQDGTGTTAADASGNNLTGTLQNQPVWDTNGPPTGGGSLRFDGQASYVQVGDQPALRMSTTMSLEAWIYPTSNVYGIILNKESEYEIERTPDGSIKWAFFNASPGWYWVNSGAKTPLNQWSQVRLTYDNGTVQVYVNGVPAGSTYYGSGSIAYNGGDFRIGGRSGLPELFQGNIAGVRVWNTITQFPPAAPTGGLAFTTRNTYDTSGRLLAAESADEGRSEYVYAQDGRIRFSQSALQRRDGRFSYSSYDEAGRVSESGEYAAGAYATTVFENHLTATPAANSVLQPGILESRGGSGGLYTPWCHQRSRVWYDLPFDGSADSQGNDPQLNGRQQQFLVGAVAKTQNDNVTTWYSYDELGRVTWVVQDIVGVGVKTLDYQYNFSGNVLQVAYQQDQPDRFYHYYAYDAAQRITTVHTSPDGVNRTLQAQYSYYLHGPLKRVQIASNLQGVDYTYTLQGTLKNLNHVNPSLEPGHDSPRTNGVYKDLFALTLDYFSGDYASRALDVPLPAGSNVPTRYDGTIQGAAWRTAASSEVQRVAYSYDEKSQLQNSTYGQLTGTGLNAQFMPSPVGALQEGGLTYDLNGNIQSLRRTNQSGAVTDNFSYSYKPTTNQLKEVHTGSPTGPTAISYEYDESGQMTRQSDEQGPRYFTYDVTGKTTGVYYDPAHQQPVVTFAYDDRGFRVRKTAYPPAAGPPVTTTYVRDVGGNVLATYEQVATGPVERTEVPLYGAGRLGVLTHVADGTPGGSDDYRYELSDHLGDARVVFHRPTTATEVETMEPSGVPARAAFDNDNLYRQYLPGAPSGSYVAGLSGTQPAGQELKRVLPVLQGDTITFSALVSAVALNNARNNRLAGRVQPYLLLGLAAPASDQAQPTEASRQTTAGPWLSRLAAGLSFTLGRHNAQPPVQQRTQPAWIQYQLYDEQGNPIALPKRVYLSGASNWEQLQLGVRVQQSGTIEVMAGTSSDDLLAYFDDLTVEQTGGLIVQEQHQYAFGAPLPGLSYTVGGVKHYRYGYQGAYAEHDAETGLESFELRMYNSRVGRWMGTDPEGQFDSPYSGMGNNPVSGVDPDGGWYFGWSAIKGAMIGAGVGAAVGGGLGYLIQGEWDSRNFVAGAVFGAVVGGYLGGRGSRFKSPATTPIKINYGAVTPPAVSSPPTLHAIRGKIISLTPWIDIMEGELGVQEIPGPEDNPTIVNYFNSTNYQPNDDETAWCSACMNYVMRKAGMPRTKSAAALSWEKWGQASGPVYGAVAVVNHGNGYGHVALLVGMEADGRHRLMGGNQGKPGKGRVGVDAWGLQPGETISFRVPFGYVPDRPLPVHRGKGKKKSINFQSTR